MRDRQTSERIVRWLLGRRRSSARTTRIVQYPTLPLPLLKGTLVAVRWPSGDSVELGAIVVQSSIAERFHCSQWSSRPNRAPLGWMVTRGSTLGQPGGRVGSHGREKVQVGRDPTLVAPVWPGSPVKPSGVCPLTEVDGPHACSRCDHRPLAPGRIEVRYVPFDHCARQPLWTWTKVTNQHPLANAQVSGVSMLVVVPFLMRLLSSGSSSHIRMEQI